MWYVMDLNRLAHINIPYGEVCEVRKRETTGCVLLEQNADKRVRLLLQAVQERNAQEVPQGQRRSLPKKSEGQKLKGTAHNSDFINGKMRFLQSKRQNLKAPFNTERVWRRQQKQFSGIVLAMPFAGAQDNNANFMGADTTQKEGGVIRGM